MNSLALKRACLAGISVAMFLAGCELIVDFDRTKIPGGGFDGSVDSQGIDSPINPVDARADARADAGSDAPSDAPSDNATASDGDAASTSDASDGSTAADADDGSVADADDSG